MSYFPRPGAGGTSAGFHTGDLLQSFSVEEPEGWIFCRGWVGRDNAGSPTYFGPEYEALYKFIWNNLPADTSPVNGGKGASADADWLAENKAIQLPAVHGTILLSRWTGEPDGPVSVTGSGIAGHTLGAQGGNQNVTQTLDTLFGHKHDLAETNVNVGDGANGSTNLLTSGAGGIETQFSGGGQPLMTMPPVTVVNTFIKV